MLLSAGFALMLPVIAAAGYFVYRAVGRELSVARLQSDFVAAVSHEFRTPLSAMRHFTEMLEEGETPGIVCRSTTARSEKKLAGCMRWWRVCWISGAWRPGAATIGWRMPTPQS